MSDFTVLKTKTLTEPQVSALRAFTRSSFVAPSKPPSSTSSAFTITPAIQSNACDEQQIIAAQLLAYRHALVEYLTTKYLSDALGEPSQDLESLHRNAQSAAESSGLSLEECGKIERDCAQILREALTNEDRQDLQDSYRVVQEATLQIVKQFEKFKINEDDFQEALQKIKQIEFSKESYAVLRSQLDDLRTNFDRIIDRAKKQIAQNPEWVTCILDRSIQILFLIEDRVETLGELLYDEAQNSLRRETGVERRIMLEKIAGFLTYAQTCLATQIALAGDNAEYVHLDSLLVDASEILPEARLRLVARIPISLDSAKSEQAYRWIGEVLQAGIRFQDELAFRDVSARHADWIFQGKLNLQQRLEKIATHLPDDLKSFLVPYAAAIRWFQDWENGAFMQAQTAFAKTKGLDVAQDARNVLTEICLLEKLAETSLALDQEELYRHIVEKCKVAIESGSGDPAFISMQLEGERHRVLDLLALVPRVKDGLEAEDLIEQASEAVNSMAIRSRQNEQYETFAMAQINLREKVEAARLSLAQKQSHFLHHLLSAQRDPFFRKAVTELFQRFPAARFDFRPALAFPSIGFAKGGYGKFQVTVSESFQLNLGQKEFTLIGQKEFTLTGLAPELGRSLYFLELDAKLPPELERLLNFSKRQEDLSWHGPSFFPVLDQASANSAIIMERIEANPLFETYPRLVEIQPLVPQAKTFAFFQAEPGAGMISSSLLDQTTMQVPHVCIASLQPDSPYQELTLSWFLSGKRIHPRLYADPAARECYLADRSVMQNGEIYQNLVRTLLPIEPVLESMENMPADVVAMYAPAPLMQENEKWELPLHVEKLKGDLDIATRYQRNPQAIRLAEEIINLLESARDGEANEGIRQSIQKNMSEAYRIKAGCEFAMGSYTRAESALQASIHLGSPAQQLQAKTFLAAVRIAQGGDAKEQANALEREIKGLKKSLSEKTPDGKNCYSGADKSAFYDAELNAKVELIKLYTQAEMTRAAGGILDEIIQAAADDPTLEMLKLQAQLEYGLALIDHDGKKALEILIPLSEKIHGEFESRTQYLYPLKAAISRCRAEGRFDDTNGVITIQGTWDRGAALKRALHEAASSSLAADIGFTAAGAAAGVLIGLCVASGPAAPVVVAGMLIGIAVGTLFKWGTNIVLGADKIANAYHSGIDFVTTQQLTADCFSLGLDALDFIPLLGTAAKAEATLGKMVMKDSSKEVLERGGKTYTGGVLIRNFAQEAGREVAEASVKKSWRNLYGIVARKTRTQENKQTSVRLVRRGWQSFLGTWERRIQVAFPGFMFGYDSYQATADWMDDKIGSEEWSRRLLESGAYAIRNAFINRRTASLLSRQFSESARLVLPPLHYSKQIPIVRNYLK